MSIKTELIEELRSQLGGLHQMKLGDDEYRYTVDGVTKLADRVIELEKLEVETELKGSEIEIEENLKKEEMRELSKDRKTRNVIEAAKVVIPVTAACVMAIVSMKWEKLDTLTSTAGKSALRDILRFK